MNTPRCAAHGEPTRDTTLCTRCVRELEQALAEVPAVWDDLQVTISRQTAVGYREGGRSAEHPLPYNSNAGDKADELHATLTAWVRDLHQHEGWPPGSTAGLPAPTAVSCAAWLICRLPDIRVHTAGDKIRDEITYAVNEARRATDRPKNRSRVFVGACLDDNCPGELWAYFPLVDYDPDDTSTHARIACTECQTAYPAMEWLRVGARVLKMREAS